MCDSRQNVSRNALTLSAAKETALPKFARTMALDIHQLQRCLDESQGTSAKKLVGILIDGSGYRCEAIAFSPDVGTHQTPRP